MLQSCLDKVYSLFSLFNTYLIWMAEQYELDYFVWSVSAESLEVGFYKYAYDLSLCLGIGSYIIRDTPMWTFQIQVYNCALYFKIHMHFSYFISSFNSNRRCVAVSQGLSAGCTNCCCSWKGRLTKLLSRHLLDCAISLFLAL